MTDLFKPGKITLVLDGGAGSSSKGLRGAHIWKYFKKNHTIGANNTFMENAAHSIQFSTDREIVHQCFSSITGFENCEIQYISPGAVFAKDTFFKELENCKKLGFNVSSNNIKIHPNISIVAQKDVDYERGIVDFEGNTKLKQESENLTLGSTLHGVGAARARRILRRKDVILAKDVPELLPYICNTQEEIMNHLMDGKSLLGEIAQGWQLSLFSRFYPKTTSRNCSVSAFLDDSMLPPNIAGPVVVNFRTYPIRVNNNKFMRKSDKKVLTWAEYENTKEEDRYIIKGDSGGMYDDQRELTWEEISKSANEEIAEYTSLTKLKRRVFTFSKINLLESLTYNNTGDDIYISINFMNYIDNTIKGKRTANEILTPKVSAWLKENILNKDLLEQYKARNIKFNGLFIGTWKTVDDSIFLSKEDLKNI